tara:strand:+ start:780 stop:890 length:111 start_codon:yes stop_codon:yes gene_type:complete
MHRIGKEDFLGLKTSSTLLKLTNEEKENLKALGYVQ